MSFKGDLYFYSHYIKKSSNQAFPVQLMRLYLIYVHEVRLLCVIGK